MRRSVFALFVCALPLAAAAPAQDFEGLTAAPLPGDALTDRVWMRTDRPDMPGSMQIFLGDGTLIHDSCWETYRLSSWYMRSETEIVWDEDGMTIEAEIVSLDEAELILELELVNGPVVHGFQPAPVPFVCPDMPR